MLVCCVDLFVRFELVCNLNAGCPCTTCSALLFSNNDSPSPEAVLPKLVAVAGKATDGSTDVCNSQVENVPSSPVMGSINEQNLLSVESEDPVLKNVQCTAMDDPFMCRHCSGRFTEIDMLTGHLQSIHRTAEICRDQTQCGLCAIDMKSIDELTTHINTIHKLHVHTVDKKYQKKPPHMMFPPKVHINYWFNETVVEKGKNLCKYCCKTVANMNVHMKQKHKDKCYLCRLCTDSNKLFATLTHMAAHLIRQHGGECAVCNINQLSVGAAGCINDDQSQKDMVKHLRSHYLGQTYLCDFCFFNTNKLVFIVLLFRYLHLNSFQEKMCFDFYTNELVLTFMICLDISSTIQYSTFVITYCGFIFLSI